MDFRERLERMAEQEFIHNHGIVPVESSASVENDGAGAARKQCFTNMTCYELGFVFGFLYFEKKQLVGKDVAMIDIKAVAYASFSEVSRVMHGMDRDQYFTGWQDAQMSFLAREQLYVSK